MKLKLASRAAALTLSVAGLLAGATPAFAIVNGSVDTADPHTNVGLLAIPIPGYGLVAVCSGTLVSPTVFLTAAHCTADYEAAGLSRALVTFDPQPSRLSTFHAGTMHSNSLFSKKMSDPADIAVVVLDDPVTDVAPAQLPTAGLFDAMAATGSLKGQTFTAVGYGAIGWYPAPGGPEFYTDGVRRVGVPSFMALNDSWLRLSQNPATGDSGTCYGDSGGPNFLGDSNLIASITITGDTTCRATNVTYRLDTPQARSFLGNYLTLP